MKSIGELIAGANAAAAAPASVAPVEEPQPHRVSVCYMVFAELCFVANGSRDAREKALAGLKHARRKFRAEPFIYRIETSSRKDPATGEPIWVEVDRPSA